MTLRMKNKVVLVSGAGSIGPGWGNGKACAVLYAREGAEIIAVDINLNAANETVGIIEKEGGKAIALQCDVSDSHSISTVFEKIDKYHKRIDVLHSNVGIVEVGGPEEISESSWNKLIDTNVKSLFLLTKKCIPLMIKNGKGSIIAISSIAGERYLGYPSASYSASKGAINQFIQNIAVQYAAKNIRANCVLPGLMNTPQIRHYVKSGYSSFEDERVMIDKRNSLCPTGQMGTAWDVAYASLFLASDEARYITGQKLIVDGGISSQIG
ncbi:MAG: SDR family oxidoreductase [Pseudomonadota bacterium]|nr:SDR family oxidoreductase [Pseudomonadota bacterium]